MADKITEIEIRLKATADTTANLKNLDKQLTTTLEKVERLQKAQDRGSVLKPKRLDGDSQRELKYELKVLAVLKQQKAELESIQRLRRQDTRTLAQLADLNHGKVGGSPQWVTPTSPASTASLRAMRILAGTTTGDVGSDPYVAQARESAVKQRGGINKRIRALELKEEQDANAHLQQILQTSKRYEKKARRVKPIWRTMMASAFAPRLGGPNITGQSITGQPIVIRPINTGVDGLGNPLTVAQGYRNYQKQQAQSGKLSQADRENDAELKRLERDQRRRWQAEKARTEYVARMEHKRDSNAASIDEILGRRERKGWVGLFLKPKYTEDEKYSLNHAMAKCVLPRND